MNARDLSDHLVALLRKEREAMADFLLALADFDGKRRWRELGHTSLFSYLRRELRLSAGAAQYRKTAVELIQRFAAVENALRCGQLCLSSICEVAKVVTPENAAEVLPRFFGLSRREAEAVVAAIRPATVIPEREVITPLRLTAIAPSAEVGPEIAQAEPAAGEVRPAEMHSCVNLTLAAQSDDEVRIPEMRLAAPPARPRDSSEPLTAELSRFHLTVSRQFMETLDQARDALSHSHPGASTEEILMACMQLMLGNKAKQRGLVERPRKTPPPSRPDHIPAHVRRAVMERSGGRCEWVFENGERCNSAYQVECDHVHPEALGGPATFENIRAACRPHNQLAARQVFGDAFMDRFTRRRRKRGSSRTRRVWANAATPGEEPRAGG